MEEEGVRRRRRPQKLAVNRGIRRIQGRRAAAASSQKLLVLDRQKTNPLLLVAAQHSASTCIDRKKSKIGFLLQKSKIWKYFGRGKPFPTFFEAQNYLIFAPTLGSFDPFFPIFAIQHREKTHFDLQCWSWLMPRENFDEISILHVK